MLSIYRRHRANCAQANDRMSKKCRCAIWATGTLEGKPYRKSLSTRNWEHAEQTKRKIESGNKPEQPKPITVTEALDAFVNDCENRNLNPSTLRKHKLLKTKLLSFCSAARVSALKDISPEHLRKFRQSRNLAARTAGKELDRLRSFFKYCVENEWLTKNPAKPLKAPQVKTSPRLPFAEKEIQNIVSKARDDREIAFVLTLRHTGLRIGDASLLRTSQFTENRIHLYTTKAGVPVSVLIPDNLVSLLKAIPPRGGYFFLRGDSTAMHTTADLWRRRIKALCKEAGVMPDHPHRFRHSLAADLLSRGASVEDVAAILGNSPAIVAKHYSQWIKSRQDRLDSIITETWQPALVRVK